MKNSIDQHIILEKKNHDKKCLVEKIKASCKLKLIIFKLIYNNHK